MQLILVAAGVMCSAGVASEGNYDGRSWMEGPLAMDFDVSRTEMAQPGREPAIRAAITRAMNEWNEALGFALFQLREATVDPDARFQGDRRSQIAFSVRIGPGQYFGSQFGFSDTRHGASGRLLESDLILNAKHDWEVYDGPLHYDGDGLRIAEVHRVVLHELGHLLGIGHPASDAMWTIMRSRMTDVDALTTVDLADAHRVSREILFRNRPRMRFSRRVRGGRLEIRAAVNEFFARTVWVEVTSREGIERYRLRVGNGWRRSIPVNAGRNRMRLFFRAPGLSARRLAAEAVVSM